METLAAANWEGEWTTCSHPGRQHADPSCCYFNSVPGEEVFEPSDQLIISQLPAHSSVDHLLMEDEDGFVAHHQALWNLPASGSSCISSSRFQPRPQIHTHDSFKKRKRDWNSDKDPEQYGYPASSRTFNLISHDTKSSSSSWSSSTLNFQQGGARGDVDAEAIQQMKEMMYRVAALRPVNLGAEVVEKPRRKNVRISSDPQTVAARQRRERISERLRVLQKLVPGGCKMDTASMLDEAANYLMFLRSQVKALEAMPPASAAPPPITSASISSSPSPNSHISANQLITPGVGTFNLPNCFQFPSACYNNNNNYNSSSNDDRNDEDDDDGGGRISMISYHPIPIPIPIAAPIRHNPTSNPPFLLQQYAKS